MNRYIIILFFIFFIAALNPLITVAQTDSTQTTKDSTTISVDETVNAEDDEFNIFLFVIAIGFIGAILGAAVVGAFVAAFLLFALVFFVLLGIVSTSFIVGLYKKSFESGFNTFIRISSIIAGIAIGSFCFWLIDKLFKLSITETTALITGAIGGMIGGIIISFTVIRTIRFISSYAMKKINNQ